MSLNQGSTRRATAASMAGVSTREVEHATEVFSALGDRTRMGILLLLAERERTVAELTSEFQLTQPSISRHLTVLRHAGLVERRRDGQYMLYRLRVGRLCDSTKWLFASIRREQNQPAAEPRIALERQSVPVLAGV